MSPAEFWNVLSFLEIMGAMGLAAFAFLVWLFYWS